MLEIKNVSKRYGKKEVLTGINCNFESGIYGLLGPNGAGKSTLMNIMVDLIEPTCGEVLFENQNIRKLGEKYRQHIGYLPQKVGYYGNFTAEKTLDYFAKLKGVSKEERKERIEFVLHAVNLTSVRKNKVNTFSGGMKQRLGIAVALLGNPKILILDEPTVGLDPKERMKFRKLIHDIGEDRTVLLSTHIVSDVDMIANNLILIKDGKMIAKDKRENILKNMESKVFLANIEENMSEFVQSEYQVVHMERNLEGGLDVVMISEEKPEFECRKKKATLEDVYMYYYGEKGGGSEEYNGEI